MPHIIRAGQIYTACHPLDEGRRIRISEYVAGSNRVDVVDADTGARPRSILVKELHLTAATRQGRPRRTGYVLDTGGMWRVGYSASSTFPWEWHCTTTVTTGIQRHQCPKWGVARSEAGAQQGVEDHVAAVHPAGTDAPEAEDR
ncbi:hypothetical protein [Streptomyces mobaraensis]|uniref:Uncharacterized protein n=1 Tax=Streptomyces mobaraensis TaxID=35621 RepID=A0A5N5W5E1_STRMB|nr:hypothetical protein [Streptomyces mobaraensis]KAB7839479.1 hypothetical protein FRZ00_21290 [Streptomyces mobaraensis]